MVNYSNGMIYKIESMIGDLCYVGSTTKKYLSQRMDEHRSKYKQWKNNPTSYVTSFDVFDVFEAYGVSNCKIVLIELFPCNIKDELLARKTYYIKLLNSCNKETIKETKKEYYDKEKMKITNKIYYENHKETIKETKKVKYQNNKEKYQNNKEKVKENYQKNKEKIIEFNKTYYQNNKERIKENDKIRYQKNKLQKLLNATNTSAP